MKKVKEALADYCSLPAIEAAVKNPDRKHNVGAALYEILVWQELCATAERQLKVAWAQAEASGILKSDDHYRKTQGETIAAESPSFSVVMKVSAPRTTLDKEMFLAAVAKKSRTARPWLDDLWEECQKPGKAALSKRVLEA